MKRTIYIIFLALLAIQCQKEKNIAIFQTGAFQIGLNNKGFINQLTDIRTNKNYLARNVPAPLISVRIDSVFYYPHSAKYSDSQITFYFENGLEAEVKTEEKNSHVSFELTGFNKPNKVELIAWGPIPSTIKKIIGETVGVVRNNDFAI